jgi:hypothetical protein
MNNTIRQDNESDFSNAISGEIVSAEQSNGTAIEMLERAHVDIQIATAHRFPRSITKFHEKACFMVTSDQETAESCIYTRPVGKDAFGNMTYASGESVRLAEIVAAAYGNLRVQGMIVEMNPSYVKAVGMAHDLESNTAVKAEVVESTMKKGYFNKRTGQSVPPQPYDERMRVVVAKAAMSKAIRDAIFRVVPKSLCKPIINQAMNIISGGERPLEERRANVSIWISKLGIDKNRVFSVLGIDGIPDLGEDELIELAGIRTALKEGDISIDEAFPELESDTQKKSAKEEKKNTPKAKTKKSTKKETVNIEDISDDDDDDEGDDAIDTDTDTENTPGVDVVPATDDDKEFLTYLDAAENVNNMSELVVLDKRLRLASKLSDKHKDEISKILNRKRKEM